MKILLLIISLMICSTKAMYKTKTTYQVLDKSIPLLKNISNQLNTTLYLNMNYFKNIKNTISLTGRISKNHLNINLSSFDNLDQLNNFNKEIAPLNNIRCNFVNIVISLINNVLKSIPEQDLEISNTNESNFLMRWFKPDNPDKITISVTHKYYSTQITFNCLLKEEPKTIIAPSLNPNEQEEENESEPLLEKKQK